MQDYAIPGTESLSLHHFYRAMAWLGEELPEERQDHATPFSPRTIKLAAHDQGRDRGGAVCPPTGSVHRSLRRVHGHHLALL
jgi:hypothetical protein